MAGDDATDDDALASNSDRYHSDSGADIASDSNGYLPDEIEEYDEGLRPLIERGKSMREGWWNKAGYETYWDVVKEDEAGWERMGFRSSLRKRPKRPWSARELPEAAPAEIDLDDLAADATRPRRPRSRQVNVRLTELGYDALCQAAREYGLRPTTLARLLIHRGAVAVLEKKG